MTESAISTPAYFGTRECFFKARPENLKSKTLTHTNKVMNNIFKALIAGYGAKKLGGGCLGTIIVFLIIFWLLGQF